MEGRTEVECERGRGFEEGGTKHRMSDHYSYTLKTPQPNMLLVHMNIEAYVDYGLEYLSKR